ncbi:hypothetical protein ACFRR7_09565 [Streptomyces sp. NPDC056909]|uniref:hypothetical protein n=1 Tax=unclassified Streptomyces TaxID=2593676 RepID=UPI00369447E0|nr:hypothetical protein OG214_12490 [Streptomyces sp. NBC_00872]
MNHPRFLFVPRTDTETGTVSVVWRLLGANNRGLGQGWESQPGLVACRAAVAALREGVTRARPVVTVSETTGLWIWRLDLDGRSVALAGRSYQRQRECHYSLANFVKAVPEAHLAPGLVSLSARRMPHPPGDRPPRLLADFPKPRAAGAGAR